MGEDKEQRFRLMWLVVLQWYINNLLPINLKCEMFHQVFSFIISHLSSLLLLLLQLQNIEKNSNYTSVSIF